MNAIFKSTFIWIAVLAIVPPLLAGNPVPNQPGVDFSEHSPVIELKDVLSPYNAPASREADASRWYMITATNEAVRPVTRVLVAEDPPDAALDFFPRRARPEIRQVASSDSAVTVDRMRAFARHAYQVTIPPATSASLAIRVAYAGDPPSVLAWTQSALFAHNRQLAIFLAGVAGLIAAAMLIMAGVAVVTAHPVPYWAAIVLALVFLMRLQGAGVFDAGWFTYIGGPYGLSAMLAGFALAAGLCLTNLVAPFAERWPSLGTWVNRLWLGVAGLSLLAFVGLPGAAVLVQALVLIGTAAIAAYLVHRGLKGSKAARVLAPSATIFALVAAVSAVVAVGAFRDNPMASGAVAGFVAVGAVLLALAVAAGEGIAVLPIAAGHPRPAASTGKGKEQQSATASALEAGTSKAQQSSAGTMALKALHAAHQGIFDLDFDADMLRLSRDAALFAGHKSAGAIGQEQWIARIHPKDRQVYTNALRDYRSNPGLAFRIEFRARQRNDEYRWLELRATILSDGGKIGRRCLGVIADVTGRKESEPLGGIRTPRDPLTGFGTRAALLEDVKHLGNTCADAAVAIVDIDRFKAIHASLGDAGGDQVLVAFGSRLAKHFKGTARVYRCGGDAFALLFPTAGDLHRSLGGHIAKLCSEPFFVNGRTVFASASSGLAAGCDADNASRLITKAEIALAQARREGGGRSAVFDAGMEQALQDDAVVLEADLRRGLAENEFEVLYQPIIRLGDRTIAGFEALLRWSHPQRGLMSPAEFIPHSERTGSIIALGQLVLERAADDLAGWQRYFPVEPPLFASVNLSRRQLCDQNLRLAIRQILATGRLQPGSFVLEITESAAATWHEIRRTLEELHSMGAGLAMDDFGTGFSSLSRLKDFPFDTIKIDKSFLAEKRDANGDAVVSSMVALARQMCRTVIAEGVETERDALWLTELGCEYAQGFHFAAPLSCHEALKFIAKKFKTDAAPTFGRAAPQARPA